MAFKLDESVMVWLSGRDWPEPCRLMDARADLYEVGQWLYSGNGCALPARDPAPKVLCVMPRPNDASIDGAEQTYLRRNAAGRR